ncbi:Uncharacterised protein [Bordetella pertussis]|nr:Uncharacterised protein [Bordetella pertussis]
MRITISPTWPAGRVRSSSSTTRIATPSQVLPRLSDFSGGASGESDAPKP